VPPSGSALRRPVDQLTLAELLGAYGYTRSVGGAPDPAAPIATLDDLAAWLDGEPAVRALFLDVKLAAGQDELAATLVTALDAAIAPRGGLALYLLSTEDAMVRTFAGEIARVGRDDLHPVRDFEDGDALDDARALGLDDVTIGLTPLRAESEVIDQVDRLVDAREDARDIDLVVVWTLDTSQQIGRFIFHGVDGIISNDPGRVHDLWQMTL
jgi:glycerophosphoryl diester phosphodiesterase